MTDVLVWHNPRCSKSREAVRLLEEAGHEVTLRRYLSEEPTEDELRAVHARLGGPVLDMMRTKEAAFKEAGLSKESDDEDLFAAMARHPILIERPIAFANGKAVIGRPPEKVLGIV
ncbi:arsenate reductase [Dinoroseobacter shibae DFL 12 = DSM 16493]|jgi:arsenate reductase|uniref:Arsenate reductase n=1 Tax=Dinoroseobacter shibae (strain DSM 16493 / NCIMB 14021 / DFL 12) TaxID=398580 RepID=A8LRE1_DINSH|nr:arsenate reductase (glutaredoxin) [Dinoroseobacter shibae]ABV92591.1 arsenate reductase [Dinoroseobacter shibae DFL 12 = DSM 16493]URF47535.1 arsenate reductase (glutaredoxin) [Dinoroseobacter shibae]URF51846.1 arsenate reductase (glutaredoxin) [Dinoroseobacter shibae]